MSSVLLFYDLIEISGERAEMEKQAGRKHEKRGDTAREREDNAVTTSMISACSYGSGPCSSLNGDTNGNGQRLPEIAVHEGSGRH